MNSNSGQKNIEDYRNEELEKMQSGAEDSYIAVNNQDYNVEPIKQLKDLTEAQLMQHFSRGCRNIGITPESIYRAADKRRQGSLGIDELKNFIRSAKLGLSMAHANRLVYMAAQECKGTVSYPEWLQLLEIYEIAQEKEGSKDRTFTQNSLFKIADALISKKTSPEEAFDQIDSQGAGTFQLQQFVSYCLNLNKEMQNIECMCVFNHMDFDRTGKIKKQYFTGELRRYMRVRSEEKGLSISQFCPPESKVVARKPQYSVLDEQNVVESQVISPNKDTKKEDTKPIKNQNSPPADIKACQDEEDAIKVEELEIPNVDIATVYLKVKKQGIKISQFLDYLMKNISNPSLGILYYDYINALKSLGITLDEELISEFYKSLDTSSNGTWEYKEMIGYINENELNDDTVKPLFEIKAVEITQQYRLTIDQYMINENVQKETEIFQKDFQIICNKIFYTTNITQVKIILKYVTDPNSPKLLGSNIIKKLQQSLEGVNLVQQIPVNPKAGKKGQKNAIANMEIDCDAYEIILRKIKPQIKDSDYFCKRYIEQTGDDPILFPWQTILCEEKATLLKCNEIVKQLKRDGKAKWSDPEFGARQDDPLGASSLYYADNEVAKGAPMPEDIIWMRPEEILKVRITYGETQYKGKVPMFIDGGASSNDVRQSKYLGDCYFISALSLVASDDTLLRGSFDPTKNSDGKIDDAEVKAMSTGVWPDFGWKYVIIDDRLPCKEGGEIVFGQCKIANELWVCIIEKAYAKLHNNYQALISGDIAQALADLTGLVADKIRINEKIQNKETCDQLWQRLLKEKASGTLMGCSSDLEQEGYIDHPVSGMDTGIMTGHAYSLIDVFELDFHPDYAEKKKKNGYGKHRICKLRNPWGQGEWKLKWSEGLDDVDSDERKYIMKYKPQLEALYQKQLAEAPEDKKEEVEEYIIGVDDGTFLMNFKNWRTIFTNLFACIKFPKSWSGTQILSNWKDGLNSGIVKQSEDPIVCEQRFKEYATNNPQFIVEFNNKKKDTTNVYIQLVQNDGRLFIAEKYPYQRVAQFIFLAVFSLDAGQKQLEKFDKAKMKFSSSTMQLRREVDSEFICIPNGRYAIIPTAKEPGFEGKFSIRIFYECEPEDLIITGANGLQQGKDFQLGEVAEVEEDIEPVDQDFKNLLQDGINSALKGSSII